MFREKGVRLIFSTKQIYLTPFPTPFPQEVAFPKSSRTIKSELAYYVPNKVCDFDFTLGQMSWVENKRATRKKRKSRV
jgi:hypothetical protein